jgi:hypothetical protein
MIPAHETVGPGIASGDEKNASDETNPVQSQKKRHLGQMITYFGIDGSCEP